MTERAGTGKKSAVNFLLLCVERFTEIRDKGVAGGSGA